MIEKRKQLGISQEEVAKYLNLSRPTIAKIEKGERGLTKDEQIKLEELFEMTVNPEENIRIDIPQKNLDKFRQVFLYILEKVGAKPNVGQTVIYKLLYFIDFDYYEKYEKQLMGLTYIKNNHGPTPREFKKVVEEMLSNHELEEVKSNYFQFLQTKYLPVKEADLSLLNGAEIKMIDSVLDRYSDKSATELSDMTHRDTPWKVADDKENLEYEHAFYRPDEFSVGEYDEL